MAKPLHSQPVSSLFVSSLFTIPLNCKWYMVEARALAVLFVDIQAFLEVVCHATPRDSISNFADVCLGEIRELRGADPGECPHQVHINNAHMPQVNDTEE